MLSINIVSQRPGLRILKLVFLLKCGRRKAVVRESKKKSFFSKFAISHKQNMTNIIKMP